MKHTLSIAYFFFLSFLSLGQSVLKTMNRLPDTGENVSYTATFGEDNDFSFNSPFFIINGDGTVTDTITGLMWQMTDGGEMTYERAVNYSDTLNLAGYSDWRLPDAHESFSILNEQFVNPSLDTIVFTKNAAEYWWTKDKQYGDTTKIWVTNAGGGIGNHPKSETISAGGVKRFHARAVRDVILPFSIPNHFTDNGNGTITDNLTNLIWQKIPNSDTLSWEQSLSYADTLTLAGATDWRLPNIKELQSLNDESKSNPSINTTYFPGIGIKKYWSSTTLPNQTTKSWYLDTQFGITTYDLKTLKHYFICVRGNASGITGVTENEILESDILVYPNPFTSTIHLYSKANKHSCELYNTTGQLIYSGSTIEELNLSYLSRGIYLLKIKVDSKTTTVHLVKE